MTSTSGAPTLTIGASGVTSSSVFNGLITGSLALTVAGGTVFLGDINDNWTGGTTISGTGTLQLGATTLLPVAGNLSLTGSGTLDLNGFSQKTTTLSGFVNTTITNTAGAAATLTVTGPGVSEFQGTITDDGQLGLTVSGGTLSLLGTNKYSGVTTVNGGGTLAMDSPIANGGLPSAIGLSSNAASNLVLGNATSSGTLQYIYPFPSVPANTDRLFTVGGVGGAIIDSSGGAPMNWTNTGAIVFTTAGSTLTLQGSTGGTFNPLISGANSLTKTGAGTWVLPNANTYSAATTITGGTLVAANPISGTTSATGISTITIGTGTASTGTLAGPDNNGSAAVNTTSLTGNTKGYVGGGGGASNAVTVSGGGSISPNVTASNLSTPTTTFGILTINGNTTFNSGSGLLIKLNATNNDALLLTPSSVLNLAPSSGTMTVQVYSPSNNLVGGNTYVYTIAQVSGAGNLIEVNGTPVTTGSPTVLSSSNFQIVSNFAAASNFTPSLQVDSTGQNLQLVYAPAAVPEPSQILLLSVLGLGGIGSWMRRRFRKPAAA